MRWSERFVHVSCGNSKHGVSLQNSLTLSNRQRYYLRKHNKGVKTSICLWDVAKDVLKDKDLFTQYVNTLLSDGKHVCKKHPPRLVGIRLICLLHHPPLHPIPPQCHSIPPPTQQNIIQVASRGGGDLPLQLTIQSAKIC